MRYSSKLWLKLSSMAAMGVGAMGPSQCIDPGRGLRRRCYSPDECLLNPSPHKGLWPHGAGHCC